MNAQDPTFRQKKELIKQYEKGSINAEQFLDQLLGNKFVHRQKDKSKGHVLKGLFGKK